MKKVASAWASGGSPWQRKMANLIGAGAVEIDGPVPGYPEAVGEARSKASRVVPLGTQVIVEHIQDTANPVWWKAFTSRFSASVPPHEFWTAKA